MSTLPMRAPAQSKIWSLPSTVLARAAAITLTIIDVYTEAQHLAQEAQKRYPYLNV